VEVESGSDLLPVLVSCHPSPIPYTICHDQMTEARADVRFDGFFLAILIVPGAKHLLRGKEVVVHCSLNVAKECATSMPVAK
jgi:hypothetical protein